MQTVDAIIDKTGKVRLLEAIALSTSHRAQVTILEEDAPEETLRPFGLCAGEFVVPVNFDDPLPDNILNPFEGR